jgi:feruloyl esterase
MRNWSWVLAVICAALIGTGVPVPARAQVSPSVGPEVAVAAESTCRALAAQEFGAVPDAPTQVTASRIVPAANGLPAHCEVLGYVSPNVGFRLLLPLVDWNGKFAQVGCGGFCGVSLPRACDGVLMRGYACAWTDMGHQSTAVDAKWAYNNTQAEIDFAYRATHVVTLAAKAVIQRFYSSDPRRSYFLGCSTGGRQGMVEAQRFPWDYDGIVAGAPAIAETGDGMALLWNVVSTLGSDGRSILTPEDLKLVHVAALARCDGDDGVHDGLIGDPRACRFDPAELQCKAGQEDACLNAAAVAAVRRIYRGPVNSRGEQLYTGGAMPGSELNWIDSYLATDGTRAAYERFMANFFGYMAFVPDPGPVWKVGDFDWDRDYKRLDLMEALYSGSNPDLRRFKAAGGKLIVYQGWADQSVLPLNIVDYYETAERTMGGRGPTQEFMRLYMIPGMNHCIGGEGAHTVDYLTYLESWVEQGRAPDMMIAVHPKAWTWRGLWWGDRQPAPQDVEFSRPLYPFPLQARYKGNGDTRAATSYEPLDPLAGAARMRPQR